VVDLKYNAEGVISTRDAGVPGEPGFPIVPLNAIEYVNILVNDTPPTDNTIGIVPLLLTKEVVQVNVIVGDAPLSAEHLNFNPAIPVSVSVVAAVLPFTETIVTVCAVEPLYANT
jgi:hypothetical protein